MLLQITEPGAVDAIQEDNRIALGIDLGTTHSVAAVIINGEPVALRFHDGNALIPSVLDANGEVLFNYVDGMESIRSSKRLMGRGVDDKVAKKFNNLCHDVDGHLALKIGNKTLTPMECAKAILSYIKRESEDILDQKITDAVITVPAYFDDAARQMTKDAAELAGLNVLRLINEPTAAALAYGLENNSQGYYAVYDFGGGTFDVSILHLDRGVFQVIATGGDLDLGGDDVDLRLLEGLDIQVTPKNLLKAKSAKESISLGQAVEVEFDSVHYTIDERLLDGVAESIVEQTITITNNVLTDAKMSPDQIDGVILVGGSTRLNLVRKKLSNIFGQKLLFDIDPDQAVALGAAIQAQSLVGGGNHLLLDVAPLSLGIETLGGVVEKVIWRNTPLPASVIQEYTTQQDGQTGFDIHIVQGEREFAHDNRSLARFEFKGLPALPRGRIRVEIKFQLDVDGILTVSAMEKATGISQSIEIKPSYGLSSDKIESMLEDALKNGRSDMEERLLSRVKQKSCDLLDDLERALEKDSDLLSPQEHQKITTHMESLKSEIEGNDRDAISLILKGLEELANDFANLRINHYIKASKEHVAS